MVPRDYQQKLAGYAPGDSVKKFTAVVQEVWDSPILRINSYPLNTI